MFNCSSINSIIGPKQTGGLVYRLRDLLNIRKTLVLFAVGCDTKNVGCDTKNVYSKFSREIHGKNKKCDGLTIHVLRLTNEKTTVLANFVFETNKMHQIKFSLY